jgi:hypothetical protein
MFAGGIWMLDLTKVAGQVRGMAEVAREYEDGLGAKLRLASSLLSEGEWRKLAAKVRESKTSWLTAHPTEQLTADHPRSPRASFMLFVKSWFGADSLRER